jgi:hypothetical protein
MRYAFLCATIGTYRKFPAGENESGISLIVLGLKKIGMRPKINNQQWKFSIGYLIWFVAMIWLLRTSLAPTQPREVSYSDFLPEVKAGHPEQAVRAS